MLDSIRLQNFRSYTDESFEFGPGVNIIVGPNASGKTNLLESVLVATRGGSFRAKDAELIQFEKPWARLETHARGAARVVKLEKQNAATKKTFEINDQIFQRLSLQKTIPAVLFEPNHLSLLTGPPELRRNFLDDLSEQTTPGFGATRRAYRRVLAQRNALLKKGFTTAKPQVFVWNLRLSELGGRIAGERLKLVEGINKLVSETYRGLSNATANVQIEYQSNCTSVQYETSLLRNLETNLERDCILGFTNTGPHRDDVQIILNDRAAEETASRGETRSLILTLKIIELQLLEKARDETPLLLLDDVFSELDGKRRHALTAYLKNYQTFITTTDADVVLKHFTESCNIIPLG
ncbi:MAG TPA: DNA replication/repair protein RecF [Candidatus Saccharimonadales bacterium]|jgi:DNA replication and repair protein RecF